MTNLEANLRHLAQRGAAGYITAAEQDRQHMAFIAKEMSDRAYVWISADKIADAKLALASGAAKCCSTCRPYGAPGYIVNANQWVNCPACN